MDPKWYPDRNRPTFRGETVLLTAYIVEITTILIPSKPLRILLGLPLFLFCAFQTRKHTTGAIPDDYLTAINMIWFMLRWFDLAILNEPEVSFWRDDTSNPEKKPETTSQGSLLERWKWSMSLCSTYRGIGWNWRVKNVDRISPAVPRR